MFFTAGILSLMGCGPTYKDAQRADTIEAFEAFLEADPDSPYKSPAEKRLEELVFELAQKEDTLEAWERYTTRFALGGKNYPVALKRHAKLAFAQMVADGSIGAIEGYLEMFGKADQILASRATGWLKSLQYGKLELSEPRIEKVNLAEDPKGDLNGWGVAVDVKNGGEEVLAYVQLTVEWRDGAGAEVVTRDYPLVSDRWTMPATDEQQRPMAAGESRTWTWTEDFQVLPEDKAPKAFVFPTGVRAVEKK